MTPEQQFSRWVKFTLIIFAAMFGYFLVADIWFPQTPESTVMRVVTPVSSRAPGYVTHIYVTNNSQVKKGDLLYEIDPRPYQNQVESARIAYQQATLDNQQIDAQISATRAKIRAAQLDAQNAGRDYQRYHALDHNQLISRQALDTAYTTWQTGLQTVENLNATLNQLIISRGSRDGNNVTLQKYQNMLEEANLNLNYTKVRADSDGVVSNLQLKEGWYANAGVASMALVNTTPDIIADFREKSLTKTHVGTAAEIVFDALPGQVYKATVASRDAGVMAGQQDINGYLAAPQESNRWVRDAQRMRIHLALDPDQHIDLPAGARATVQLYNSGNGVSSFLGRLQIRLISLLHYVY
nr:HlyD family secretion protein [Rosenbergiella epipactidis]